jgi:hypothetical protein
MNDQFPRSGHCSPGRRTAYTNWMSYLVTTGANLEDGAKERVRMWSWNRAQVDRFFMSWLGHCADCVISSGICLQSLCYLVKKYLNCKEKEILLHATEETGLEVHKLGTINTCIWKRKCTSSKLVININANRNFLFVTYVLGVPLTNIKLFLKETEEECVMKQVIVVTELENYY